jgi:hypothetical protein
MATRRTGSDTEGQTVGGFLDSIIAKREPGDKRKGPDHLANRQQIASWLDSLPLTEPTRAKEAAFALLLEQDSLRLPFTVERTDALFHLDRGMHPNLLKLESDYLAAKVGGELEQVLSRSCSDLGRAFIVTYERAFTDNLERLGSRAALQTLTLVLARIVHFLAWQARLCAYRRADWIPGRWQQLHRMYRKARAFNVQLYEVPDLSDPARRRKTTIESEYLSLLLMWRLNSGTLSRTEIAQAYYWLRDRPRQVLFVGTHRPGARLGVDPTQPDGLKPVAYLGSVAEKFLFDSTVLAEPLTATLARLEERQRAVVNEVEGRRLRQQIELVGYLITHWVVNRFTDRAERTALDRRVEVAAGWPDIAMKLRWLDRAHNERATDKVDKSAPAQAPSRPVAGASDSGLSRGWGHDGPDRRSTELWIVRDESVSGCRVVSPAGKGGGLKVGDAIALHDPLTDQWDVALVRRWKLAGEDRVEMGLLWFGRNAKPLKLFPVLSGFRSNEAKPVDGLGGEPAGGNGEFLLALLPAAACADLQRSWERAAPWGKSVLRIESIELPGTDWCWARLRVVANEPSVVGARSAQPPTDGITEIEITAPRE